VPHFGDPEALAAAARSSGALGFMGMGCIHPAQIQPVNQGYSPSGFEIGQAKKIVYAFHQAEQQGLGVVSVDSKMVDAPVVKRALKTIENAIDFGMLDNKWMENDGNEPD
jgi:citrate lyase subunit beta / citryl-CoA lyase